MIDIKKYINNNFSQELKLLVQLSQDELTPEIHAHLNEVDWDSFVDLTIKHRLISHVLKHSEFLAENIPIWVYEKLIEIRLAFSKKSLNYAVHAIRIFQKFTENKIQHCFFKGPLLSLELYNDIAYRNFGDIDILVEQKDIEKAKQIIEELDFKCIYPNIKLSDKQKKVNYSISHHYHFIHPQQAIDIELHWSITNPKSFFGLDAKTIISNSRKLKVSNYELPYISNIHNLAYQAAHGSIHQFYRLFWLKDFSKLIDISSEEDLKKAYELSKTLKLDKCFNQALQLSKIVYNTNSSEFKVTNSLIEIPLKSIATTDLKQRGVMGKIRFVKYRLKVKKDNKYFFDLVYRLRTHLTDWETIHFSDKLFFIYLLFRPFFLIYHNFKKKP